MLCVMFHCPECNADFFQDEEETDRDGGEYVTTCTRCPAQVYSDWVEDDNLGAFETDDENVW